MSEENRRKFFRYFILACLIGGGAFGIIVTIYFIIKLSVSGLLLIFFLLFIVIYAIGIYAGIKIIKRQEVGLRIAKIYWGMQIITFLSPIVSYQFYSGIELTLFSNLNLTFDLGSGFEFNLLAQKSSWALGVNLFALPVFLKLIQMKSVLRLHLPDPDKKPAEPKQA